MTIPIRGPIFVPTVLAGFLLCGTAVAQSGDENWERCAAQDLDVSIPGCTAIIQIGRPREHLLDTYLNRGDDYRRKGQYDRAIRDFDQAIRLDPNSWAAHSSRGLAYSQKGQYDRAIQDYDRAIRLKSDVPQLIRSAECAFALANQPAVASGERRPEVPQAASRL